MVAANENTLNGALTLPDLPGPGGLQVDAQGHVSVGGGGGGNLSGTLTPGIVPVASAPHTLVDGTWDETTAGIVLTSRGIVASGVLTDPGGSGLTLGTTGGSPINLLIPFPAHTCVGAAPEAWFTSPAIPGVAHVTARFTADLAAPTGETFSYVLDAQVRVVAGVVQLRPLDEQIFDPDGTGWSVSFTPSGNTFIAMVTAAAGVVCTGAVYEVLGIA